MKISLKRCCEELKKMQDVAILCHRNPDGDTLGCGFALYNMLKYLGIRSKVVCHDGHPKMYDFLYEGYEESDFEPSFIVAVDVADEKLLGDSLDEYKGRVDLCIDHHGTNKHYAKKYYVDGDAAAACEIMEKVCKGLKVPVSKQIADCIYTGVATDTGCFKFPNTTQNTHECAGRMIKAGCDYVVINRLMFEVKTHGRIELEKEVINNIEYHFENRCALTYITLEMMQRNGIAEPELEGVTAIPRQIEGVEVGLVIRERDGIYKISVRTSNEVDASAICAELGGGGHFCAAGCSYDGDFDSAKEKLLEAVTKVTGWRE